MSSHYRLVADAIAQLADAPAQPPPLSALSKRAGLSPAHFQRVFTRHVGVSPKRFAQVLTLDDAERRLLAGADVLTASTASGLSGPGRLHDLTVSLRAMTPGELRRGGADLEIAWDLGATLLGDAVVATTERGVCALELLEDGDSAEATLRARFPRATLQRRAGAGAEALAVLRDASAAKGPLALHVRGTDFQVQVWRALVATRAGERITYGELARGLGRPTAARAIGQAVGANPIAVLIPCHRVLRSHGGLGGYRWGPARKRALLALEHP